MGAGNRWEWKTEGDDRERGKDCATLIYWGMVPRSVERSGDDEAFVRVSSLH